MFDRLFVTFARTREIFDCFFIVQKRFQINFDRSKLYRNCVEFFVEFVV